MFTSPTIPNTLKFSGQIPKGIQFVIIIVRIRRGPLGMHLATTPAKVVLPAATAMHIGHQKDYVRNNFGKLIYKEKKWLQK